MSTAGRPSGETPAASELAARLREEGFVHLVAAQTGDAVAATALLARALDSAGVPYQTSVVALPERATRATDTDCTLGVGRPATADVTLGTDGRPASTAAFEVAAELGDPDPALALAGTLAAGRYPDETLLAAAEDIERRPGVAVPVADLADGLAHSTLVHAPFSGAVERAASALDNIASDEDGDESGAGEAGPDPRAVASLVALAVAGDEAGTPRGAESVERVLRPFVAGPLETAGGYGDVLDAVVRERPGQALAFALGGDVDLLPVWRDHTERAHAAVREAETGRYSGLFVARCADRPPVGTVARLVHEYRSPEPVTLAVGDGIATAVTEPDAAADAGEALAEAAASVGGTGAGTQTHARATFDGDRSAFVLATTEAV
jgi:hypothetical protein